MIIDIILDCKNDDELLKQGYTHYKNWDGTMKKIGYNPRKFYTDILMYVGGCGGSWAENITRAMDCGTEEDVKRELCKYIDEGKYNPAIKDYINGRNWLGEVTC